VIASWSLTLSTFEPVRTSPSPNPPNSTPSCTMSSYQGPSPPRPIFLPPHHAHIGPIPPLPTRIPLPRLASLPSRVPASPRLPSQPNLNNLDLFERETKRPLILPNRLCFSVRFGDCFEAAGPIGSGGRSGRGAMFGCNGMVRSLREIAGIHGIVVSDV
jgi:hypothetical protein